MDQAPEPITIDLSNIRTLSESQGIPLVEAARLIATAAAGLAEELETRIPNGWVNYFVSCRGTWNTGDPHSWHSRSYRNNSVPAWRDYLAHVQNEPDATHSGRLFSYGP
jgi:hypothetical protein